ncbi:MAG TPA: ABC transporter permease [Capillimicrobium sp.]|nr:ABC transporter permease [Capillimicrobium sp.]
MMARLALKGLAARPLRTALTALAIVLGVALVSAALTLGATLRKGADALSASAYDGTAAVVASRTPFELSAADGQQAPPIPAGVLGDVRAVDGVGVAAGEILDQAQVIVDGEPSSDGGPYFAEGIDAGAPGAEALTPFRLRDGAWASGPDEVVLDAGTADREGVAVGDRVEVATRGPARAFTVSGIARFSGVDSIGKGSAVVFDLATAQALFHKEGRFDHVLVAAADGVDPAALRHDLAAALPDREVTTAAAGDRFQLGELSTVVDVVSAVLLAFGLVAVLVGAFTILNAFSITVTQRTRELALLRMAGGARGQVRRMVLAEALLLGAGASVAGAALGIGLASLLQSALRSLGLDLPTAGLVVAPSSLAVALAVGTIATVVAALVPARRATRVEPVEALAQTAGAERRRGVVARAMGAVVSLLGRPAERLGGVAGRLARRNAMRNPGRTAVTATALAIGVALVTLVSVVAAGLKDTTVDSLERRLQATHVVGGSDGWSPIDPQVERRLAAAPGVEAVTSFRQDGALAFAERERLNAVDPATVGELFDFDWVDGSARTLTGLRAGDAIVDEGYAKEHDLAVGDRFAVTSPTGARTELTVRGVERSPVLDMLNMGPITVSAATFDAGGFAARRNTLTLVRASDDAAVQRVVGAFPDAKASAEGDWIAEQAAGLDGIVAFFAVLLALCVMVSLFGIVNALVLAGFERTRELGTLRALGMSRRQMRRMVRHESIVTALLGAVLGIGAGLALAAVVTAAFAAEGLAFAVPVTAIVAFCVLAVVAGVVAAALPARRAARLDVLGALAWE